MRNRGAQPLSCGLLTHICVAVSTTQVAELGGVPDGEAALAGGGEGGTPTLRRFDAPAGGFDLGRDDVVDVHSVPGAFTR